MLTIRLARGGRRNSAFFRIVLTEKSKPSDSGFIKVLGWYDPHSKKISLQKEEILQWVKVGAKPSNSLSKLLKENKITHKNIKFVPDAKGAPKTKEKKAPAKAPAAKATGEKQEDMKAGAEKTAEKEESPESAEGKQEDTKTEAEVEGEKAAEKKESPDQPDKEDKKTSDKISEEV